jgi:hypothetical protein
MMDRVHVGLTMSSLAAGRILNRFPGIFTNSYGRNAPFFSLALQYDVQERKPDA